MEITVSNADFSACNIGKYVSIEVIAMMAKYTNFASNKMALGAMQKFYDTIGATTLAKCTIIVPCLAANVTEAMKDLVTGTDLRSSSFDGSYFAITSGKGIIAANGASATTADYRRFNAVNGGRNKYSGQLRLWALSVGNSTSYLGGGSDMGNVAANRFVLDSTGLTSLAGMTNEGLSFRGYALIGFDTSKGIVGYLDNQSNGSKYTIFDADNEYSVNRAVAETTGGVIAYNNNYLCQSYYDSANTDTPISMHVWGYEITDTEAVTIRDAVYQFMKDMGINPA